VLGEQRNVARIEALSLVEVGLAPLPLTSPPRDKASDSGIWLLFGRN
jgi:hypothetical protein